MNWITRWKERRQFDRTVRSDVNHLLYIIDQLGGGSIDQVGANDLRVDIVRGDRTFRMVIDLFPKQPLIKANGLLLFELSKAETKRAHTTIADAHRRYRRYKQSTYETDRQSYLQVILGD